MRKVMGFALVLLVLALGSSDLRADTVYAQVPNWTDAYISDPGYPQWMADDFRLTGDTFVTDVHWLGIYVQTPSNPDGFTVAFYDEGSGPNSTPFASFNVGDVGRLDTGMTMQGYVVYAYSCFLPSPILFDGGVTYYISISNATNPTTASDWYWCESNNGNDRLWYRTSAVGAWSEYDADLAFALTDDGVVPEPLTSLLFGASVLVGLGRLRRRRS